MEKENNVVSLGLAVALTIISVVVVFVAFVGKDYGFHNISKIFGYPELFRDYIAQAIGASVFLPAINVAIISVFKTKRNPSTRRRVFIGWSLVIIVVQLLTGFLGEHSV